MSYYNTIKSMYMVDERGFTLRTGQWDYMVPEFRKQEILKSITDKGVAQIAELAEICGVSQATIRRDLNELAHEGAVQRTYGGAIMRSGESREHPHQQKLLLMKPEKARIGLAAAQMVADGDSIFLDSGTTALEVARHLNNLQNITVVTNNTDIIGCIQLHPSSQLIVTGGVMRFGFNVLVGPTAVELLRNMTIDKVFIGADAVSASDGLFSSTFVEVSLKLTSVKSGRTRILITDSTKFHMHGLIRVCPLDDFDAIITDAGLEPDLVAQLEKAKPRLVIV